MAIVQTRALKFIRPALPLLVDHPPDQPGWIHEIKFDGYRIQAQIKNGKVKLLTRSPLDWTKKYPGIEAALKKLKVKNATIDGEIVALDQKGRSNFELLQQKMQNPGSAHLFYYVFDLLEHDDEDLRSLPLLQRKKILKKLVSPLRSPLIRFSEHLKANGEKFFTVSCRQELEGTVSKRVDSPYVSGRGKTWVKSKCKNRQEFIIGGYTDPGGSRSHFGSLLLGVYQEGKLRYAGKCGTGFDQQTLESLGSKMKKLERSTSPFQLKSPREKNIHWIQPKLVAEISFANWTKDQLLRVPAFQGIREDKEPSQIIMEKQTITHADKIMYEKEHITKQEIADYYASPFVSKFMLPLISNRPLALNRCPDGTDAECFYQKHLEGWGEYITVKTVNDLMELARLAAFEIHVWGSREPDLDHPDQIVMDFDPSEEVSFIELKKAVLDFKKILDQLGLNSFLKVTGGKGLHVHVPISPSYSWEEIKSFSKTLAEIMVKKFPDRFVSTQSKEARKGKIYIDYLRNARGSLAIAPYSLRARKVSSVAMPIEWKDLARLKNPAYFTLKKSLRHLKNRKKDPWAKFLQTRQKLLTH